MREETKDNLEWAISDAKQAIEHLDDIALDENLDIGPARSAFIEAIMQVEKLNDAYYPEQMWKVRSEKGE